MTASSSVKRTRVSTGNKRDKNAHEAILDAAKDLLIERGPAGLAMEAVAKKAGVGKPTVYRWWADRTELLLELLEREYIKGPDFSGAASLEEELTHRMTYLFHVWRDTPAGKVFTGLLIEMQSTPEAIERFRTEALIPRRIESTKIFERAKIRGEIDLETKISALLDLLYGWSWYRLLTGNLACDDDFNSTIRLIARAGRGD